MTTIQQVIDVLRRDLSYANRDKAVDMLRDMDKPISFTSMLPMTVAPDIFKDCESFTFDMITEESNSGDKAFDAWINGKKYRDLSK